MKRLGKNSLKTPIDALSVCICKLNDIVAAAKKIPSFRSYRLRGGISTMTSFFFCVCRSFYLTFFHRLLFPFISAPFLIFLFFKPRCQCSFGYNCLLHSDRYRFFFFLFFSFFFFLLHFLFTDNLFLKKRKKDTFYGCIFVLISLLFPGSVLSFIRSRYIFLSSSMGSPNLSLITYPVKRSAISYLT